jgi:hypothetical protein
LAGIDFASFWRLKSGAAVFRLALHPAPAPCITVFLAFRHPEALPGMPLAEARYEDSRRWFPGAPKQPD